MSAEAIMARYLAGEMRWPEASVLMSELENGGGIVAPIEPVCYAPGAHSDAQLSLIGESCRYIVDTERVTHCRDVKASESEYCAVHHETVFGVPA